MEKFVPRNYYNEYRGKAEREREMEGDRWHNKREDSEREGFYRREREERGNQEKWS